MVSLGSGTFFRDMESTPRRAAEAQTAQAADALNSDKLPYIQKMPYSDKGMDKFLSAYSTLHCLTCYPEMETVV